MRNNLAVITLLALVTMAKLAYAAPADRSTPAAITNLTARQEVRFEEPQIYRASGVFRSPRKKRSRNHSVARFSIVVSIPANATGIQRE